MFRSDPHRSYYRARALDFVYAWAGPSHHLQEIEA